MTLLVDPMSLTVEPLRRYVCDVCHDVEPELCGCLGDVCRCGAQGRCSACGSEPIEEPEEE